MTTVGTFEAKTHLTQLLGRVARGERILITNRGQPVAMLVPPGAGGPRGRRRGRPARCSRPATTDGPTLGKGLTARQMREEGRRF